MKKPIPFKEFFSYLAEEGKCVPKAIAFLFVAPVFLFVVYPVVKVVYLIKKRF